MVAHGEDVGQHLGGVPLAGQAVPHRHPRVAAEDLGGLLGEAPVGDAVEHAAEDPRHVPGRFPAAQVRFAGAQVADVRALVVRGDLERGPDPG